VDVKLKNVKALRDYICEGCNSYIVSSNNGDIKTICQAPHKKNGHICPCSICLVKGMCISTCDKFVSYLGNDKYTPKELKGLEVRVIDYQTKPEWMKSKSTRFA